MMWARPINPGLVQGQIEGAVVQAEGYALTENLISREGHLLTDQLNWKRLRGLFAGLLIVRGRDRNSRTAPVSPGNCRGAGVGPIRLCYWLCPFCW